MDSNCTRIPPLRHYTHTKVSTNFRLRMMHLLPKDLLASKKAGCEQGARERRAAPHNREHVEGYTREERNSKTRKRNANANEALEREREREEGLFANSRQLNAAKFKVWALSLPKVALSVSVACTIPHRRPIVCLFCLEASRRPSVRPSAFAIRKVSMTFTTR